MKSDQKALKDGLRCGQFITAHGILDVTLKQARKRFNPPRPGRMNVIVFAWQGSGFPPEHHSLN